MPVSTFFHTENRGFVLHDIFNFETAHPADVDEAYHVLNIGNIGNVVYWTRFLEMVRNVPGAIVECGIGRARSLLVMAALNKLLDPGEGGGRAIYGYDSFEGFPEPSPEDASKRDPKKGDWSHSPSGKYKYDSDFIRTVLDNACITGEIGLEKGYFTDSLRNYSKEPIALLHVDGDLYESYIDVLNALYPFVCIGGVIVFDDFMYNAPPDEKWPGARKAVDEFFHGTGQTLRESIRGNPYIIKS